MRKLCEIAVEALLLAGASFGLGLLLMQETFYGPDGWRLCRIGSGDLRSNLHPFFGPVVYPVLNGFREVFGWSIFHAFEATCALGTAVAVMLHHVAFRMLLPEARWRAVAASGLVAALPGVVFYATVIEMHGVFLAFAGLAWIAFAGAVSRPGLVSGVCLGLAVAVAYSVHSTGVLMLALFAPWLWWRHRRDGLIAVVAAGGAAVVGVAVVKALAVWLGLSTAEASGENVDFIRAYFIGNLTKIRPWSVLVTWLQEQVLPFLPVSIAALLLAFLPRWRGVRDVPRGLPTAVVCGGAVYLAFAFVILAEFNERGAYLLPWGVTAALLTAAALPVRLLAGAIALAGVTAVIQVRLHDTDPTAPVAAALDALDGDPAEPPYLLPSAIPDFELIYAEYPGFEMPGDFINMLDARAMPADRVPDASVVLVVALRDVLRRGRVVWISKATVDELADDPLRPDWKAGPMLLAVMRESFVWRAADVAGREGFRLRTR